MAEPVRSRGRGQGCGRGGGGGERETWTDREKDIIRALIAPGTEYYKRLKGKATSLQLYETLKLCKKSVLNSVMNLDGPL